MRYIYYIIFILLFLSAVIGYELRSKGSSHKNAAIIVNDKVISVEEFNRLYSSRPRDIGDQSDFINSLITKELLIQQSQKEGIDREESFRRSVQNFYEQSLIKILMDRKCACLKITVTEDEVDRYIALLNKKVYLTIFSFDNPEEARKGNYGDGQHKGIYFEDLSKDMRDSIRSLKEGEITGPVKIGEKYLIMRLDRTENIRSGTPSDLERDKIKKMLIDEKKEKALSDWVADLKKRATIRVLIKDKS